MVNPIAMMSHFPVIDVDFDMNNGAGNGAGVGGKFKNFKA